MLLHKILVAAFLICLTFWSSASTPKAIDSLLVVLQESKSKDISDLETLARLVVKEPNPIKLEKYADTLIKYAVQYSSQEHIIEGYILKGNADRKQSNYDESLRSFFKALELSEEFNYLRFKGMAESSIADVYSLSGNSSNAQTYYDYAIETLEKTEDSISLATVYLNAGDEYLNVDQFEKAIEYFEYSGDIFDKAGNRMAVAYNFGNLGMAYAETNRKEIAEDYMNKAIVILEELNELYPISVYLTYLADIYIDKGDLNQALVYSTRSLDLATEHALKNEISDAHHKLSEIYNLQNNKELAFDHYKKHILYRDSINDIETVEKLANQRTDFEVSQKQIEVNLSEQKRKSQQIISMATGGIALLIGILTYLLYRNNKYIKKTSKIIQKEKDKSDKLLLNILPAQTAQELKENGKVAAKRYDSVSVLFADFVGFTKYAESLAPENLVQTIDHYFTKFDEIMKDFEIEKIKTIGDAYMCASGLPTHTEDHTLRLINAAIAMKDYVKTETKKSPDQRALNIRIGINSGPVVAGVVGSSKFAYDIWGDTVNTASRLESYSVPGKINISETTYQLIKEHFECTEREPLEVKSKGFINMYFVHS